MTDNPLISIIVPVYKVERELPRCIESLLNQTFQDIEIILVDDGSPDNCPNMCDNYSKIDRRIKVIHKKNGGLSDARNFGINIASGKYIMFVDSDDFITNDACEKFSEFLESDADVYIGLLKNEDGSLYSRKSNATVGEKISGEEYFVLYNHSMLACSVASLYKSSLLKEHNIRFVKGRYHEDNDFTPRIYIESSSIVYTGIVFYIRCSRDDSITQHTDKRKNLADILFISRGLSKYANTIKNTEVRKTLRENLCDSYLFMFRSANIYQYKNINYAEYIDKKLVLGNGYGWKNRMKSFLFVVSPRLYVWIANKVWAS